MSLARKIKWLLKTPIALVGLSLLLAGCLTNTQGADSKTETEITIPGVGTAKWGSSVGNDKSGKGPTSKPTTPPNPTEDAKIEKMRSCLLDARRSYGTLDPCTCFEIYKVKPTGKYVARCPYTRSWRDET